MKGHRRHAKRFSNRIIVAMAVGVIVVYAVLLLGIQVIGDYLEQKGVHESVGSLEGRFDTQLPTLETQGRTWNYRKNKLTNILFIGTDWNTEDDGQNVTRYAGQADFLLLVTLDKGNKTISSLQIDRDTLADIRIYGVLGDYAGTRHTQICLSHAFGDTQESACENTVWGPMHGHTGIPSNRQSLCLDRATGATCQSCASAACAIRPRH